RDNSSQSNDSNGFVRVDLFVEVQRQGGEIEIDVNGNHENHRNELPRESRQHSPFDFAKVVICPNGIKGRGSKCLTMSFTRCTLSTSKSQTPRNELISK